MEVEAGLSCALLVVRLAPSGGRHQKQMRAPGTLADRAGDLVAVHPREIDVQKNGIRPKSLAHVQPRSSVACEPNPVAAQAQQDREALSRVAIVFDQQHAPMLASTLVL